MNLRNRTKETLAGYLFVLPNLIGFAVFTAFGVAYSLTISFTDWDMFAKLSEVKFVGLNNYTDLAQDPWFIASIKNNFYFVLFIPLQMLLALTVAVLLKNKFFGSNAIRNMIYLPYITSFVAIALIWFQLFHPSQGFINHIIRGFGITNPPGWFGSSLWVKPALLIVMTWQGLGFKMMMYLAGLQGIPRHLYEAAEMDGASGFRKFMHVTIPLISPITFYVFIISIIETFTMWSSIQVLTRGGPGTSSTVIGYYIYKLAFVHNKMGYASAIAWVLFIIVLVITLIQWRRQKKRDD